MTRGKRLALASVSGAVCAALTALWLFGAFAPVPTHAEPSDALMAVSAGLDDIQISAALDADRRTLSVKQILTLTNRTGAALDMAVLRAWPNAFQSAELSPAASDELYESCYPDGFSTGALIMSSASSSIDGSPPEAVTWRYADEQKTVMQLPIREGWAQGSKLTLDLSYDIIIPRAAYRFGVQNGIFALGNAFLIPAIYEDGVWRDDPYTPVGDPFISDCANYEVRIDVPSGYICAGSADPVVASAGERSVYSFSAKAARDFGLVIGSGFETARGSEGATVIACHARNAGKARELLGIAKRALACYGERCGAYPYPSFTLAEIDYPLNGAEYPAFAMISGKAIAEGGESLEYIAAREIAHQWWYAAVGSDQANQPWQDEALCEFSALEYIETRFGRSRREELEQAEVQSAMRALVPGGLTPGMPISYFESMSLYSTVVRSRGAALFCALDRLLPEGLDPFLREYYARFSFGRASRRDFEALINSFTGEDLAPLITDYLDTIIIN